VQNNKNKSKKSLEWEKFKKEIEEKAEKGELSEDELLIYLLYWMPMGIYLYDVYKKKLKK